MVSTDIRKFRSKKACYLLDLNGNVLNEFDNLQCCARFLKNKTQISSNRFNNGSVVNRKYRIFTIDYYNKNKKNILKLKNYTRVFKEKSLKGKPKHVCNYIVDLEGNILHESMTLRESAEFLNKKVIGKHQLNKGSILSKKYRIFSKDYFNENKEEVLKLKNYSSYTEVINSKRIKRNKRLIKTILFPNQYFTKQEIAKKLKRSNQFIRTELNKHYSERKFGLLFDNE